MRCLVFGVGLAAALSIATVLSPAANELPSLQADMTIPELVAELEERGYRKAEFVESDQRGIILDVVAPGGNQVRLKYLAGTGKVVHAEDGNED